MKRLLLAFTLIATLLPSLATASPSAQAVQIEGMEYAQASISAYYHDVFSIEGLPYHDPHVVFPTKEKPYSNDVCTGGTPVYEGFWAFYCPVDETIVLEGPVLAGWAEQDTFIPMFVMAHEWGHHIQKLEGIDTPAVMCSVFICEQDDIDPGDWDIVYSIELEQMADCLGGSWMAYLEGEGILNDSDVANLVYFMAQTLDGGISTAPQSHGDAAQRINATLRGYHHGFFGCMTLNPLDGIPTPVPEATPIG